jgi:hypothetical protein
MTSHDDQPGADAGDHDAAPVAVGRYATAGEAQIAQAKLRAFGIEAAIDDQTEGGTVLVDGEPTVNVEVAAADADDAVRILHERG